LYEEVYEKFPARPLLLVDSVGYSPTVLEEVVQCPITQEEHLVYSIFFMKGDSYGQAKLSTGSLGSPDGVFERLSR
jgi:hypothetical protein